MSKLIDMKLPKRSKEELAKACEPIGVEQDKWPWGLRLTFENDDVAKIPELLNYSAGDKVLITAEATVTEISKVEKQSGKDRNRVEIQIEKIACDPATKKRLESMSMKEYKKERMKE